MNEHVCHSAVMVHCRERGDEMIVGDLSHLHIYEQGGSAQVSIPTHSSMPHPVACPVLHLCVCVC